MKSIKLVLWERKIAYQQAQYLLQKTTRQCQLEEKGMSLQDIQSILEKEFPQPVEEIGKKQKKFRLQDRFKGNVKERMARDKVESRWFIE